MNSKSLEVSSEEEQPKEKKLKGFLKAAFMGAVVTGGIKYMVRSSVSLTGPAGIAMVSVSTAVALTAWEMLLEYRKMRKKLTSKEAIANITSKKSLKKYGLRLIFNTASAAVGVLAFTSLDSLLNSTNTGLWIKDTIKSWFLDTSSSVTFDADKNIVNNSTFTPDLLDKEILETSLNGDIANISKDTAVNIDNNTSDISLSEEKIPQSDSVSDVPDMPDISGVAGELIAAMHGQDLSPKAQEIYDGLVKDQTWALESAGVGILNGKYDLPAVSKDTAIAMIKEAANRGNSNALIDLAYFQYHGLHGVETNKEQALKTINELGRAWVGGEELLESKDTRVALCDIFEDSKTADCEISSDSISAGEYVEIKNSDGTTNIFYLEEGAATRDTRSFVADRVLDSLILSSTKKAI